MPGKDNEPKAPVLNIRLALFLASFCFLTLLLVSACASTDPRTYPDFGTSGLLDGDPLLASAALAAEYVQDIYARAFLLTRITEEYLRQNRLVQARSMLRRAVNLTLKPAAAPNRYQLKTELARFFITLDDIPMARQLLQEALDQVLTLNNEDLRGAALESIIERAFQAQEAFPDLLRNSIDYIYVLENPIKRVDLLVKLGQKYQDKNVRNRADSLVQQAIAAASAINNPWEKARALALIARRFQAEDNKIVAKQYFDQALQTINDIEVLAISMDDARVLLDLIINLADTGHLREASATIPILPTEQLRVNAQLIIIERSILQKSELQTRLLLQRLLNNLSQQDPEGQSELALTSLIKMAEIYLEANLNSEAVKYARSAMPYLASPQVTNISAHRARLALVLAKANLNDEALAGAGLIPDAWIGSQTLRQIAELLFLRKEPVTKTRTNAIRALLIESEQLAGQATYLRESAFADVASSSFRTGDDIRAIRILQDITDPYLLGKTLVDGVASRPNGDVYNPETLKKLELLRNRLQSRMPSRR